MRQVEESLRVAVLVREAPLAAAPLEAPSRHR